MVFLIANPERKCIFLREIISDLCINPGQVYDDESEDEVEKAEAAPTSQPDICDKVMIVPLITAIFW